MAFMLSAFELLLRSDSMFPRESQVQQRVIACLDRASVVLILPYFTDCVAEWACLCRLPASAVTRRL